MNINITIDGVQHTAVPVDYSMPGMGYAEPRTPATFSPERELKVLFEEARKFIRVSEEGGTFSARDRNGLRRALKGVKAMYPQGTFPADCA